MVGELAGHACDRRVRMKSAGATPVARHCLPVLSGIRRRAARGPMPSPTLFERIPPAARDIARWPFFLCPTSGSASYPLADGSGKTGGSLADRRCMLSGAIVIGITSNLHLQASYCMFATIITSQITLQRRAGSGCLTALAARYGRVQPPPTRRRAAAGCAGSRHGVVAGSRCWLASGLPLSARSRHHRLCRIKCFTRRDDGVPAPARFRLCRRRPRLR